MQIRVHLLQTSLLDLILALALCSTSLQAILHSTRVRGQASAGEAACLFLLRSGC